MRERADAQSAAQGRGRSMRSGLFGHGFSKRFASFDPMHFRKRYGCGRLCCPTTKRKTFGFGWTSVRPKPFFRHIQNLVKPSHHALADWPIIPIHVTKDSYCLGLSNRPNNPRLSGTSCLTGFGPSPMGTSSGGADPTVAINIRTWLSLFRNSELGDISSDFR
jgi:hypothetical protein